MSYDTIRVRFDGDICFLQIHRPDANNCINQRLVEECTTVVRQCEDRAKLLVLEGLPEVFCFGADFQELSAQVPGGSQLETHADALYDLWLSLAFGSFISVAHVRGKVNAGGVGFVAACDIVLCEQRSVFSLSELLFGLMPACVLPFLIRRIGAAKANYLTVMTQPISAEQALNWHLVDACEENSVNLLRKHLLRMRCLSKPAVARYKRYLRSLDVTLAAARPKAIDANREVFGDEENLRKIGRYLSTGQFPWEGE